MQSYTFRDYPLESAFKCALRFGWDGMELQGAHFDQVNLGSELDRCMEIGEKYATPIHCIDFSADFISDDPKIALESVELVERNIAVCAEKSIFLMNGLTGYLVADPQNFGKNGSTLATDTHYERAAEALRHLGNVASDQGVRLTLEIHMNTIHDTVASTARLLDLVGSDHVLANPDPGNMFSTSTAEKSPEALDALAGRIGYFHLKNCLEENGFYSYSVRLADGHIDTYRYLEKLDALDYNGAVCIEYCGAGDPQVAAQRDIQYLRNCLEWLIEGRPYL